MAYLKRHDVLYVTLVSAFELPQELVDRVDKATKELLAQVNGKTSLWVLQDPSFIGGLRLRIGDTIYDGSVIEQLYHFERRINRDPITTEDAAKELLEEFTEKARNFEKDIFVYQLGRVMQISDGICWMDGLADIRCGLPGILLQFCKNLIIKIIHRGYSLIRGSFWNYAGIIT